MPPAQRIPVVIPGDWRTVAMIPPIRISCQLAAAAMNPLSWAFILLALVHLQGFAASEPRAGREPLSGAAPPLDLEDLKGTSWSLKQLEGKPSILVFGELENRNTMAALSKIQKIVTPVEESGTKVPVVLVCSSQKPSSEILEILGEKGLRVVVLRDPERKSYSSYKVLVLPTTVILGIHGNVIASIAGYSIDFSDRVTDGLLSAAEINQRGKLPRERTPLPQEKGDDNKRRASRICRLAERIGQRGFPEMAEDEFQSALKLDPNCAAARVGLGRLMISRKRLEEAEAEFRKALKIAPESLEATLGLATVEVLRGGEELASARTRLERILEQVGEEPEALFLLGRIAESQKDLEGAVDYYKRAAVRALQERGTDFKRIVQ
jgi:hypothetical protein